MLSTTLRPSACHPGESRDPTHNDQGAATWAPAFAGVTSRVVTGTRLRTLNETMTPAELTAYLRTNIPLTIAMDVSAVRVEPDTVVLEAPLAPNINHRKTVFGGSASALGILAAWSLVHLRLAETKLEHRLVIQRNTMSYDAPIEGTFTATARTPKEPTGRNCSTCSSGAARRGSGRWRS